MKFYYEVYVLCYFNFVFILRVKELENEFLVRGVEYFLRCVKFLKIFELVLKNLGIIFVFF